MTGSETSWLKRHQFLLRRLHSLSGVIPVGVFLIVHLFTNSLPAIGPAKFDEHVLWIHHLPYLLLIEVFGIFLPLAFHAGYGMIIAAEGRTNVRHYGWADNWRYALQRWTAWIALVFVLVHVLHFRFAHWLGGANYQAEIADNWSPTEVTREMFLTVPYVGQWVWVVFYFVGLAASVYHLCNGLITFCITWGVTVGDLARRRVAVVATGLGALLMIWGTLAIYSLAVKAEMRPARTNVVQAPAIPATPAIDSAGTR